MRWPSGHAIGRRVNGKIPGNMMEYHAVHFEPHGIAPFRRILMSSLDMGKREKIEEFRFQDDRDRALVGAVLSRTVLCGRLAIRNGELAIGISPSGKPFVKGVENCDFNIAHSGNWIVCGADNGRIGVDVEKIGVADAGFADRYFAPVEAEYLRASDMGSRTQLFYSIWTLKESYVKAVGKGLTLPMDGFSIRFRPQGIRAETEGCDVGFHFRLFPDLDPDFSFAMCSENLPPDEAKVWTLENLIAVYLRLL